MSSLLSRLTNIPLYVISHSGYLGMFVLSALESCGIPIPSEVVLPFSGFLAAQGKFSLLAVILLATLANLAGSVILYGIGRSGGRWILERYGKYVFIHEKELSQGDEWFKKHGVAAIFFGRMLPIVRTFISLPAGINRVPFVRFVIYTFLGALPWNAALAYVGYKTGEHWEVLHPYFQKLNFAIVAVIIVGAVVYLYRHRRHKLK